MKPLNLTLTGLRSYPTQVTIDFTEKTLVAALGDTGAGKSSLLDAITYALFRKSSWDATSPRQLIADGAEAMSVELTFRHNQERWKVHRTMHTRNANAGRHHLQNLDTGDEFDGATNVDTRIKSLLQMGHETFLRVGILPQGKFDQLLTANATERSARLRELFGTDSLETIRKTADHHSRQLLKLLGDARAKRSPMPDHPAQDAAEAEAAATVATTRAERLTEAIERAGALQKGAAAARATEQAVAAAAQHLSASIVTDADTILDELEPLAADIATQRNILDQRASQAETQTAQLSEAITAADANGERQEALTKAAVSLETLAPRAADLRDRDEALTRRAEELAGEGEALTNDEAQLAERDSHLEPQTRAARAAADASKDIRTSAAKARTRTTAAISAAEQLTRAAGAQRTAEENCANLRDELARTEEEEAADNSVATAAARVESLQRQDRAAAIATELHPGDDCPVCCQQLPAGFEPEPTNNAAELLSAKKELKQAEKAHRQRTDGLAAARAAVTAAEKTVNERSIDHQSARLKAQEATSAAERALHNLQALAADAAIPGAGFDVASAIAALAHATTKDTAGTEHPVASVDDTTGACEQAAATHAERLQLEIASAAATIEADRQALQTRRSNHRRDLDTARKDSKRHSQTLARTNTELHALPARIRAMLPDQATDVTDDHATTALTAVTASLNEIQRLLQQQQKATSEQAAIVTAHRALDKETRTRLEQPLTQLHMRLDIWAETAVQASAHLGVADQLCLPQAPADADITETRQFATDLAKTTTSLNGKLTTASTAASNDVTTALTALGGIAAEFDDIDDFDPTADLTVPDALHPLVAAADQAKREAQAQHSKKQAAQDLIKPAADLDFAIKAGQARQEALDVLRRELVDAKFLGHLTALRTRALLGVASDLLGQMTDGRFGFAEGFNIVSRASGVTHVPNRLSGGEKFLASLALALALAELYSRSGSALGSLFLDEGFAALDTTALETALDILRTQTDEDRFVMVISHLHAVADAVDDVLWVERAPAGSRARWLTAAERDELSQADLSSGLQTLMR
ncbi:SMC family ATPase [Kitasatospora indigofera]|uniref:SMC family ATPase n=1 Tax=Kitasatospora indigofera TaxID=67307 RepID=UPI0033A0F1DD